MGIRSKWIILVLVIFISVVSLHSASVSASSGHLEIVGVPDELLAGRYDTKAGLFSADVSEYPDAMIRIRFEDTTITGKVLEWHIEDDYLKITNEATVNQKKLELTAHQVEYYSEDERLIATGDLTVITEDATIQSQKMEYLEKEDKAIFLGDVVVNVEDGVFKGQHFVMYIEEEAMEFIGPFTGEFHRED